ncbi:MAG: hypothetical protein QGE99_02720 [SAR202 cluster bacterium]|nr:hypothetical protein [SAR202 cluster bacterium]HJO60364.1 hypothetical protein [SAR202 cluster bacterium]
MDKVIVTALLVIAGVTAAGLVMTTLTPIVGSSSQSVVESQKDLSRRIQTDFEITAVHADSDVLVRAWIKNVGGANISFIEQSDVFVSSTDKEQFVFLCYDEPISCTENKWSAFEKDGVTKKTGYWTEGETIQLTLSLKDDAISKLVQSTRTYNFEFTTSNGVKSAYQFKYGQ